MNIRTGLAVAAILFTTPILAAEFTQPEVEETAVVPFRAAGTGATPEFQCARIAWESTETFQYGAIGPMNPDDAEMWIVNLEQTGWDGKYGVYHFVLPSECYEEDER